MQIENLEINFLKVGRGPDLILLPGWGQSLEMWKNILLQLSKNYTVYLIDLPGFGKSSEPTDVWDISDYANFLHKFILNQKIEYPIIVGHSFGGRIALNYFRKYGAKKLVLYSTNLSNKFNFLRFINNLSIKLFVDIFPNFLYYLHVNFLHPNSYKNFTSINKRRSQTMLQIYRQTHTSNKVIKEITPVDKNILLIGGEKDWINKNFSSKNTLENGVEIKSAGHFAHITNRKEFMEILNNFLATE